ncbi:hypothetical protein N0V90_009972 [Kalmusia sp. IMI 367209]|nr:hypothetical protein N0V90_009972 [Kalmusia sp. IMI 367209]
MAPAGNTAPATAPAVFTLDDATRVPSVRVALPGPSGPTSAWVWVPAYMVPPPPPGNPPPGLWPAGEAPPPPLRTGGPDEHFMCSTDKL